MTFLEKYKEVFIPFQYPNKDKYKDQNMKLADMSFYRTAAGSIINRTLSVYFEYFFEFVPYLIMWHNENLYYRNEYEYYINLKSLVENSIRISFQ